MLIEESTFAAVTLLLAIVALPTSSVSAHRTARIHRSEVLRTSVAAE
jgi:hypothetical protein